MEKGAKMSKKNEFLEAREMSDVEQKKQSAAKILAILTIIISIFLGAGFITGMLVLPVFLMVINLLFGPVTLFFYFREVAKGVFRVEDEEDTE
jgi:uncharacterized membrane protein